MEENKFYYSVINALKDCNEETRLCEVDETYNGIEFFDKHKDEINFAIKYNNSSDARDAQDYGFMAFCKDRIVFKDNKDSDESEGEVLYKDISSISADLSFVDWNCPDANDDIFVFDLKEGEDICIIVKPKMGDYILEKLTERCLFGELPFIIDDLFSIGHVEFYNKDVYYKIFRDTFKEFLKGVRHGLEELGKPILEKNKENKGEKQMNDLNNNEVKFEDLEITYIGVNNDQVEMTKRFTGKWLVEDGFDENARTGGIGVWIALTTKGKLLYHWIHSNSGIGGYTIYDDFKALEDDNIGPNLLSAVAYELGIGYAEFLDI